MSCLELIGHLNTFEMIYGFYAVIPIFLREIETVTSHCENHSALSLPTEFLACRLESLTAMLYFIILASRANGEIRETAATTQLVSSCL